MAKGQKRSNREQKKPKQDKPKTVAAAPPLALPNKGGAPPRPGSKK